MTEELNEKLAQLKKLEDQIKLLGGEKDALRKEVFATIESEDLGQYKCDIATISRVERKTIKFVKDKEDVLKSLEESNLVKYFEVIPEHKEFSKEFDKDVKAGIEIEGVEVDIKTSPMIRFNSLT